MKEKHPAASVCQPLPDPSSVTALGVDEATLSKAIQSFPNGSSGGPDGLRPQHLKDLVNNKESGQGLVTALTSFTNLLLNGNCPDAVMPFFFGGRLIALEKKAGGFRPIVVGLTLRRLVSKCANSVVSASLQDKFLPRQLGVGTSGGCEAAVHSARRFIQSMPLDYVVAKIDFTNAFNAHIVVTCSKPVFRESPEIYKYCHQLMSEEGTQHADPLGPLIFCLAVQHLLNSINSSFAAGYMDDFTVGGYRSRCGTRCATYHPSRSRHRPKRQHLQM